MLGTVVVLTAVVAGVWIVFDYVKGHVAGSYELDVLLADGARRPAKLVSVDGGRHYLTSGTTRWYRVGIEVEFKDDAQRVKSNIGVPEHLRHLLQAGAPCQVVADRADPTRLCLVSIDNAFGASTEVKLGSMYSRG